MDEFQIAMIAFGALLVGGALLSGLTRRSFLSLTAVYVLAGFALGQGGFDVLGFTSQESFVSDLAIIALVVILFRDGLEVDGELLQREWRLPLRKLVLAMPITAGIIALAAHWIVGLDWLESFLLGALLSPTDPVLSSSVVTNPRVPRLIRHSLNLESGLNDGLALPPVLALSAALAIGENDFVWWRFILEDLTIGFAAGIAIGWIASKLLPRGSGLQAGIPDHHKVLYAIGVAVLTYGILAYAHHGNPFIAVFVCAITLGVRRPDLRFYFEAGAMEIVEIVKLGVFVVFGAILTAEGPVRRRLGRRGDRLRHVPRRAAGGDLAVADRHGRVARLAVEGVHGVVRAQGRRDDDLLAVHPRRGHPGRGADHEPRGALRRDVDHRPRPDRHAGLRVDGAPRGAGPPRCRAARRARAGGRRRLSGGAQVACSAACSAALGNCHVARVRRSCRKTSRI